MADNNTAQLTQAQVDVEVATSIPNRQRASKRFQLIIISAILVITIVTVAVLASTGMIRTKNDERTESTSEIVDDVADKDTIKVIEGHEALTLPVSTVDNDADVIEVKSLEENVNKTTTPTQTASPSEPVETVKLSEPAETMNLIEPVKTSKLAQPVETVKLVEPAKPKMTAREKIPSGPLGCSNTPMRAPLASIHFADQFPQEGEFLSVLSQACPEGGFRYTLTECDLLRAMTTRDGIEVPWDVTQTYMDSVIRRYLPHLLMAIEAFDLNCSPERLSNFLAQIRHETNGLRMMYQESDNGAGSVHMIPQHFARIIKQVKPINKAFQQEFGTDVKYAMSVLETIALNPANTTKWSSSELPVITRTRDVLASDTVTFLVGGWWYTHGSQQVLGYNGCRDLRTIADAGLGEMKGIDSTGFFKTSVCIFGTSTDSGLEQRVDFYNVIFNGAKRFWKLQSI